MKNLTSNLIGRFAYAAIERTRESLVERDRSDAQLVVPNTTLAEIALLKSMVFVCVMQKRKQFYVLQAKALLRLVEKYGNLLVRMHMPLMIFFARIGSLQSVRRKTPGCFGSNC